MYVDTLLSRVLVDISSSLNVIPKATLNHLQFKGPEMRVNALIVKAFDGSMRQVRGKVDLPIRVGPHQFTITFQVMDINPTYSFLLGIPWIHEAGAMTSTLYQRLKFMINDKLVIVLGEEYLLVSELSSFIYVETEEGVVEIPLHCLEFEDVNSTTSNHDQSSATILSSIRSAKKILEKGLLSGWGQIVNVTKKHNKFGIGYHPSACKVSPRKQKKFNPIKFSSAGYQDNHTVAVVGEANGSKQETPNFIRRYPPRFKLTNWTTFMIPIVYSKKM